VVYLYGVSDQPLGFRLIPLILLDWSKVFPKLWRCVNGIPPRAEADATVVNLGGGQFVAILSAGDSSGDYITFQLEADNCISDEKTILPFVGSPPGGGLTVEDYPLVHTFLNTVTLETDTASGLVISQPAAHAVRLALLDATTIQRGLMSAGPQTFAAAKDFYAPLTVLSVAGVAYLDLSEPGSGGRGRYAATSSGSTSEYFETFPTLTAAWTLQQGDPLIPAGILSAWDNVGVLTDACYGAVDHLGGLQTGQWVSLAGLDFSGGLLTGGVYAPLWSDLSGTPTTLAGYGIMSPLDLAQGGTAADLSATGPGVLVQSAGGAAVSVVAPGTAGHLLTSVGGVWASAAPAITSPLTTKGDLWGFDTGDARVPIGPDGDVLTADSTQPLGLKWAAGGGSLAIGAAIAGGTAGRVLFEGAGPVLADDLYFVYGGLGFLTLVNNVGQKVVINNGSVPLHMDDGVSTIADLGRSGRAGDFRDGSHIVFLADGVNAVTAYAGLIYSLGTSGNTYSWGAGTSAPTPQAVIALPLSAFGGGAISQVLGTPDQWGLVNVAGTNYKVPMYL